MINSCHNSALCRSGEEHARALAKFIFLASLSDSIQDDANKDDLKALNVGNMFVHLLLDNAHAHRHAWDQMPEEYSLIRSKLEFDEAKRSYEYWLADAERVKR